MFSIFLFNHHGKTLCGECGARNTGEIISLSFIGAPHAEGCSVKANMWINHGCPLRDWATNASEQPTFPVADFRFNDENSSKYARQYVHYFNNKYTGEIMSLSFIYAVKVVDGKIKSFTKNGKILFSKKEIMKAARLLFGDLCSNFSNWARDNSILVDDYMDLVDLYYKGKNGTIKDLRVNAIKFLEAYRPQERAKIYKATREKGTKEGIRYLTKADTKPLQNFLLKNLDCIMYAQNLKNAGFTEDQVCLLANKVNDVHAAFFSAAHDAVEYGYSIKAVLKADYRNIFDIPDVKRMIKRIKRSVPSYAVPEHVSLADLHDYVMHSMLALRNQDIEKELRQPDVLDMRIGKYTFSAPKTQKELFECGSKMVICVSAYASDVDSGEIDIYIVGTEEERFFACLSVIGNKLHQAKMYRNRLALQDASLTAVIKEWCDMNGIDRGYSTDLDTGAKNFPGVLRDPDPLGLGDHFELNDGLDILRIQPQRPAQIDIDIDGPLPF